MVVGMSRGRKGELTVHTSLSRPGLVVLDENLNLVASNAEAIHILTFPDSPGKVSDLDGRLPARIRSRLADWRSPSTDGFVSRFKSAKRTYLCHSFPLNIRVNGSPPDSPSLILLLERNSNGTTSVSDMFERFGLTPREQETVKLLLQGLTSKEIAERMKISPNTVKAFIRLVMVKMDVSTRSGIIGKIVGPQAQIHTRSSPIG
jgi:DNA-binding CsgD family transcriptional regulator